MRRSGAAARTVRRRRASWTSGALAGLAALALGYVGNAPHPAPAAPPAAAPVQPAPATGRPLLVAPSPGRPPVASPAPATPGTGPVPPCGQRAEGSTGADQADALLGREAAVEFRVMRTFDTGKVTFLNSQDPYQGHFYVAIFPDDYGAFAAPPAELFAGRCVLVQGRVELYKGTPQIVLRTPQDILILDE